MSVITEVDFTNGGNQPAAVAHHGPMRAGDMGRSKTGSSAVSLPPESLSPMDDPRSALYVSGRNKAEKLAKLNDQEQLKRSRR